MPLARPLANQMTAMMRMSAAPSPSRVCFHFGMQDLSLLHGNPQLYVPTSGGKYSSAFGRYQITNSTANWLRCTDWTPSGQDDCGADLLGRIGATAFAPAGNFQQAISRMAPQWSSMPGGQQPQMTMDQARQLFDRAIGYLPECNK